MASLTIILQQPASPKSAIHPGSLLSGLVKLTSQSPSRIAHVKISFRGRSKVKIRSSEHYTTRSYRSQAIFFLLEQKLFDGGGFTHKAGEYSWPFTFRMPETVPVEDVAKEMMENADKMPKRHLDHNGMMQRTEQVGERGSDFFEAREPWRGSRDLRAHPLLDSFEFVSSKWPIDWEGRVEYELSAVVVRGSGGLFPKLSRSKDLETKQMLRVERLPQADIEALLLERQKKVIVKAVSLKAEGDKRSWLGLTTKSLIGPGSGPKFDLGIEITTAKHVLPGARLPLTLQLVEPWPVGGVVVHRALTLQLFSTTAVRDNATSALEQVAQRTNAVWSFRQQNLDGMIPSAEQGVLNVDRSLEMEVDFGIPPSFSTYNIARSYRLAVELKLDCPEGYPLIISCDNLEVTVLPKSLLDNEKATEETVPSYDERPVEKEDFKVEGGPAAPSPEVDEEQLPAYKP